MFWKVYKKYLGDECKLTKELPKELQDVLRSFKDLEDEIVNKI